AHARPSGRAGCRTAARGCRGSRHRRGTQRDLRPEARARRPDSCGDVGVRRRDHRQARRRRRLREGENMRKKVTVVGAGNVGATCAQEIARRDYADVVLVDIIPSYPQGKALDMNQAGSVLGYEPTITGSNRYDESEGSDVVV